MKGEVHPTLRWGAVLLLLVVAAVEVVPWLWMVVTSLKALPETLAVPPTLWPQEAQWGNYAEVWGAAPFGRYLWGSVLVATVTAALQGALSCMAGYAFARVRFRGREALFTVVLSCLLIPAQVRFVSVFLLLDELGLINTYAAQILPHGASALGIFLMRQAFSAVPQELIDAAKVDGAGTLRIIFQVMVPLAAPTLVAFLLFSFVYHWNDYFWPLVVTLDESVRPLPLGVALMQEQGTGARWHLIMAANVILVLPLLAVFVLAQRRIVGAFVATSLK
jgi:sn-glycerol 3-phosphate transport system permease protein